MYGLSSLPVRATASAFQVLGLICTVWRIYFRLRIDRFWWEDAWAAVALLSCLASLVGEWTFVLTYGSSSNVGYWLYILGFTSVVRASHLSILFSITRIVHGSRLSAFTYLCAVCCGIFWIVIITGKVQQCASDPSWHRYSIPACDVHTQIFILESVSDCLMVGMLIALPLRVLWGVKLPTRQRRMILSIFASSIVLAFAALFHVVGHVLNITVLIVAGIDFEVAFSITVCNLLVIVTYVYRRMHLDGGGSEAMTTSETVTDFTQPRRSVRPSSRPLTVEVDSPISMTSRYTSHISVQDSFISTS